MYISLVNHSHYSVLEGYGTVQEYIAKAKQLGMPALGLTDKGTAMGLFTFIKECNKNDVTPLPGLELFVRDEEDNEIYNLHLLATSNKGMRSITKLVSLSWLEENYNVKQERPTVLLQDLINYQEDLIVLSGNQDSQISTYITNEKYNKAIEIASRLKDVFKDNFYIELAIGTKNNLNKLVELAEELNIKTVITPGVYYTEKDEWEQHEVFLAINSKSKMEETPQRLGGKRKSLDSTSHWFMSEEEVRETVRQFNIPEEAYSNTFEIYEKIKNGNIRFINNPQLRPHVEVPEKYDSEFDYFKGLVKEGFLKKRGAASKDVQKESLKRIAYETDVLKSGNFISYFLTTADLVKESHREGHNTGLGRGCFLPGNNVRMTRGIDRPIENIKVGDSVLTHDTKLHKVLNTMKYYIEEECIKITLNNGKEITCTTDHKIFKKDFGFIEAKDLLVGDTLLGAKRNSEIAGTLTCVGECGKTREFNVKTGRHLFGPSYYKQSGEWICNDCRNKQNYKHPIIMQTLKENAERQAYDEEYKQRMSQTLKDHWAENYEERVSNYRAWVNSDKSLGWRKSLSEANYRRYSDPKEVEKLKFHKNNYRKGWMYDIDKSTKNPIWYDSSYEQKAINILNTLSEVKQFGRYKYSESITYYDKETGRERQYIPDFVISLKDGTKVILEVKSLWDIDRQRNQDKFEAAYNFVENSDKYDKFIIWTENELEELNDFLHHEFTVKSIEFFDYKGYVYDIEVEDVHNYTIEGVTVHNSAGGSEIAYLLDIHETDPIKFDLMFDRFLSKGRFSIAKLTFDDGTEEEHMISDIIDGKYVHQIEKGDKLYNGSKTVTNYEIVHVGSSPDVDTDYHTQIRDDIINYSKEKYGVDKAANIITFNTMLAKGAFRDIAARYGIYPSDYNNISKAIPDSYRDPLSTLLDKNNPDGEELRATLNRVRDKYINNALTDNEKKAVQEKFDKIVKFTDNLHNRIKSVGAHPAGVIISSVDLSEVVPVRTDPKDFKHVIEWEYPDCEYLGLIKWDFLGLNTINIIEGAIDNVNENYNVKLDMKDIIDNKLNDPKAINIFKTAQTETIFQYSGGGVKELLSNLRPDNFDEVAAVTAIFRPGPMSIGYHTSFVNRKNGTEELIPLHKEFEGTVIEEILEPTLNQLIYQEQVLQIAQRAAGFTATEADKFRRAIGKKDADVMASMKVKFIEGIKNNLHVSDDALTTLWDGILGFSAYAFNKCLKYDTYVYLKDSSRITIKELYKRVVEQGEDIEILSMFDDGSIKPHKVSTVHDTGQQEIWTIITENNKKIRLTANHRMLTTNGYGTIADGGLSVGTELIEDFYKKRYSDSEIERRKRQGPISASMMSPEARQKLSDKMKKYQSTLTFEDRSAHQQKIQRENPHRTDNWLKTGRERLRELEKDDEWVAKRNKNIREVLQARPKNYFGIPTEMDNGIIADSKLEAEVGNFIISLGFDFEFHKKFESKGYGKYSGSNRETDFYVDGLYIEVDGLRRGRKWFQERKYGDSIPFVVVDGDNYKEVLTDILNKEHIKNGTKIKEIIAPGEGTIPRESQTYDIEMVSEPRNFLANGLVSHNSHSISYALTAYVSAWLKAYYPAEYMASAIEAVSYNPKSFKPYISEAKRMGIDVLVPDINLGKVGATATKEGKILIGLCNIKGINTGQVKAILEERQKNGLFKDIYDFIERCHSIVSQGNLEKLIQAGAFDSLGYTRKGLILTLPELYKAVDSKDKISNSLFSLFEDANNDILRSVTISQDEYPYVEKLGYEAELLSNYLSGQPLSKVLTKTIQEQAYQNFKVYAPEKTFKTHCIVTEFKKVKSGAYYIEFTDGVNTFRSFTDDNVSQLIDNSLKKKNNNNLDLYQGTLLSTNRLDLKVNNAYTFTLRNRSYNKNYYNKNSNEVQMVYRFDIINIEELYLDLLGNPIDIYTVTDDNYEEFIQMCDSMKNGAKRIGYKIEIPEQNIFLVKQYTTVDSVLYNREYSRDLSSKFGHYHVLDNYS